MAIDLPNFLHSLATYMVARAAAATPSVVIAYSAVPRGLWRNKSIEGQTADPYSVMRIYGGPRTAHDPQPRVGIECATIGTGEDASLRQAQVLFETLFFPPTDPVQPLMPLQMTVIPGSTVAGATDNDWNLISVTINGRPGKLGEDLRQRARIVFNFEVGFFQLN